MMVKNARQEIAMVGLPGRTDSLGKLSKRFQYLVAILNIDQRRGIDIFEDDQIGATAQHRGKNNAMDAASEKVFSDVF
jgi:hypothetical protein